MPSFFSGAGGASNVGRVIALVEPHAQASFNLLRFDAPKFSFAAQKSIVTGLTLSQTGNVQFLHSLGNEIYIYVFGDRIGSLVISGVSFAAVCEEAEGSQGHGLEQTLQWYADNRVAVREEPLQLVIGSRAAFFGSLIGMQNQVLDPGLGITGFELSVALPPTST